MSNLSNHAFGHEPDMYPSRQARPRSYNSNHPSGRANAFFNLLNPSIHHNSLGAFPDIDSSSPGPQNLASNRLSYSTPQPEADPDFSNTTMEDTPSHLWGSREPLPASSRAFSVGCLDWPPGSKRSPPFFMPSYLQGSVYARKVENQYKTRLEAKDSHIRASISNGMAGLAHNGRTGISHRGAVDCTAEQSAGLTIQSGITVGNLPSKWNQLEKAPALQILTDGSEVKYAIPKSSTDCDLEAAAVRADNPIPPQCGIYYFEITILSKKREETTIGVGFSSTKASLLRPAGWEPESWGYHGDDGNVFSTQSNGRKYGPPFTTGDIIGCGINFHAGSIFFTKNGSNMGFAFTDVKTSGPIELYPIVGLKKHGEHIKANFGQAPFAFDIEGMYRDYHKRLWNEIETDLADGLAPGLDETDLIQKLVLKYLQHDGYVETAREFSQEVHQEKVNLCLDPDAKIEGPSIKDDEDATNRQAIRRAVLEGDIDQALDLTSKHYPYVLKENHQVYFRLRCRKFIEMARCAAETEIYGASISKRSNFDQRMEIDGAENGEGNVDPDTADTMSADGELLVQDMLAYGQELQEEFADDTSKEVRAALEEAFALMAYSNPLKVKEMAGLMDQKGRVAVAEELNSAILMSLGKCRRSVLEEVWAQTSVFLEMLSEGEEGSFVSIRDVIDQVPK